MNWEKYRFGSLKIDGKQYQHDVVLDRGVIRLREQKTSRSFREPFRHPALSVDEEIPWDCRRLVIGTGRFGWMPVNEEVEAEAQRRGVALITCPTSEAIEFLKTLPEDTNAILHLTC